MKNTTPKLNQSWSLMDLFLIHSMWPGPTAKLSCYSFPSWHPEEKSLRENSGRRHQMTSSKDNSSPKLVSFQKSLWSRGVIPFPMSLLPEVSKVSLGSPRNQGTMGLLNSPRSSSPRENTGFR